MAIATLILCICLILISLASSNEDLFSPSVITSFIWTLSLSLYLILPHKLPELSFLFYITLSIWISGMCLSSLSIQSCKFSTSTLNNSGKIMRNVYLIISIITLPSLITFAQDAIAAGVTGNWAKDLRLAALGKTGNNEIYGGIQVLIWQISYLLELMCFNKKNWYRTIIVALIYLVFCFISMSKWNFLNFFIMTIVVLYFKKTIKMKHIMIGIGTFLLLSIGIQTLRHNTCDSDNFLVLYLVGNMSSFDTLEPGSSAHFGENTFRMGYAIAEKMGYSSIEPISPILPWIEKPIMTNTYTGMYPFFLDFGIAGVAIFSLLIGSIYGWLYKKAKMGTTFYILLYAYFVTVIVTQYVGDMFYTNMTKHLKFGFLLALPFICTKYSVFLQSKEKDDEK